MVTLTNLRKNYDFEYTEDNITISGTLVVKEDKSIPSMYGNIVDTGVSIGDFNYSEPTSERINKSFNNLNKDKVDAVNTLLNTIITDIKSQLNA